MTAAPSAAPSLNQEIVQKIQKLFTQLEKWRAHLTKLTEDFNTGDAAIVKEIDALLDAEPNADAFIAKQKARADKRAEFDARKKAIQDAVDLLRARRDTLADSNEAEMVFVLEQILPQKRSDQQEIKELEDLYKDLTGKSYPTSAGGGAKAD
jgi:hypothetical protein